MSPADLIRAESIRRCSCPSVVEHAEGCPAARLLRALAQVIATERESCAKHAEANGAHVTASAIRRGRSGQ